MFKKSNYNILVPYEGNETIIYNPLSGAIGKFDAETLKRRVIIFKRRLRSVVDEQVEFIESIKEDY